MTGLEYSHTDKLGQQIKVDDVVVYIFSNKLVIGVVQRINRLQITVIGVNSVRSKSYRYPQDIIVITSPVSSIYILKHA
jgi:hypothetical protein